MNKSAKFQPTPVKRPAYKKDTPDKKSSPLYKIIDLDRKLLQILLKRYALLQDMRTNGRVDPKDEKQLREAWQREAGRMSRDPELSGHFFSLLQQITFLSGSSETSAAAQSVKCFTLAPAQKPVHIEMQGPLSDWDTFAWLYLGAAAGQEVHLDPCLQNDPQIDFIKTLVQMGGAVSRQDSAIITRNSAPLGAPDRVVNAGSSEFGFYLVLAHYLGKPSRVKFTGAPNLKTADFSAVRHFLPQLQARFITLVPKMEGLPARLEASGMLPAGVTLPPDIPAGFAEALILSSPFYASPFTVNLSKHDLKDSILAHVLPVLTQCGAVYSLTDYAVAVDPGNCLLPLKPDVPLDPELAAFILGFVIPLAGEVRLKGRLPDWPELKGILSFGQSAGWKMDKTEITARASVPLSQAVINSSFLLPPWGKAFLTAAVSCAALNGGKASLPEEWHADASVEDFLRMGALSMDEKGEVKRSETETAGSWNAPSPAWALALALGACARQEKRGWLLGNPAEVMNLWPFFWTFYNGLPEPACRKKEESEIVKPVSKRRIKTDVKILLPEQNEERQ